MAKNVYAVDSLSNVVVVTNQEWFTNDIKFSIRQGSASKLRVSIAVSSNSVIQFTVDGSTYISFNEDKNIIANSLYNFDVPIRNGDFFNLRTTNPSGTTVVVCRVDQVPVEG